MDTLNIYCPHTNSLSITVIQEFWGTLIPHLRSENILLPSDSIYLPPGKISVLKKDEMHKALLKHDPSTLTLAPSRRFVRDTIPYLDDDVIHLIVIRKVFPSLNVYNVPVERVEEVKDANPLATVSDLIPKRLFMVYKPLSIVRLDHVGVVSRSGLTKVMDTDILEDIYPWGCAPGEVHFFVYPTYTEEEGVPQLLKTLSYGHEPRRIYQAQEDKAIQSDQLDEHHVPASLLNEALCKFHYNLSTIIPTAHDIDAFHSKLRPVVVDTYPTWGARCYMFTRIFNMIMPQDCQILLEPPHKQEHYYDDGHISIDNDSVKFLFYIQEVKNGFFSSMAEVQGHYSEYVQSCLAQCEAKLRAINFPTIILLQLGPLISVGVAIYTTKPIIEYITTITFNCHSSNNKEMYAGEQLVGSLQVALTDLRKWHQTAFDEETKPSAMFPFRNYYELEEKKKYFIFDEAIEEKLIFKAHDEEGTKLFIKFYRQYSVDAHHMAFGHSFVPKLIVVNKFYK